MMKLHGKNYHIRPMLKVLVLKKILKMMFTFDMIRNYIQYIY